jgi:cellobiose-specific phosphotransferase system component IIC
MGLQVYHWYEVIVAIVVGVGGLAFLWSAGLWLYLAFSTREGDEFPSFLDMYKSGLLSIAAFAVVASILYALVNSADRELSARGILIVIGLYFLINSTVIHTRIKSPDGGTTGVIRSCWLSVGQIFVLIMVSTWIYAGYEKLIELLTT